MGLDQTKRSAMYNDPRTRQLRDEERSRQVEASRLEGLRDRQRKEWDALVTSHRNESEKLRHDQQVERDHASQPAGMDAKHKAAREKLMKKHEAERDKLKHQHEAEMSKSKKMPPEARIR